MVNVPSPTRPHPAQRRGEAIANPSSYLTHLSLVHLGYHIQYRLLSQFVVSNVNAGQGAIFLMKNVHSILVDPCFINKLSDAKS